MLKSLSKDEKRQEEPIARGKAIMNNYPPLSVTEESETEKKHGGSPIP
ncbi:MAG TPA: hypothetical protein PLN92_02505 [Thermotogota bacterium]|nr:hypothetical protein [Thermotogota bacterium]